jgi:hypothetical protein
MVRAAPSQREYGERERVFQSGESVWGEMTLREFGERVCS